MEEFDYEKDKNILSLFKKELFYFTKQIQVQLCRTRLAIAEKLPGAVYGEHPTVIYIKVLRRAIYYPPTSKIGRICAIRAKFNEILNDAVTHVEHRIMNVMMCSLEKHFNEKGELTPTGQKVFWQEVDNLIERYDTNQIMLLPKQPRRTQNRKGQQLNQNDYYHYEEQERRFVLPKI